jgi:hypothetical protein
MGAGGRKGVRRAYWRAEAVMIELEGSPWCNVTGGIGFSIEPIFVSRVAQGDDVFRRHVQERQEVVIAYG